MALGVPYLTGDVPAVKEVVTDKVSGFLVPVANPQVLANKIASLVHRRDLMMVVGEQAKNLFDEKYSPVVLAEDIIKIML